MHVEVRQTGAGNHPVKKWGETDSRFPSRNSSGEGPELMY